MPHPKHKDWLNEDLYIYCLQETHLKPRETYRLKDKIDFEVTAVKRDKG